MDQKRKKVLICGAGSIGVYIGTKLHLKGYDIQLFGRKKLSNVKETIIIDNKKYDVPEKLFSVPKNEDVDVIIITTKLYDFEKMIEIIKKNKIKYRKIAAVQNGLVDTSKYSKILNHNIVPVTVFAGFNLTGKEIIVRPTRIGWITPDTSDGREICRILADSGIPCSSRKDFNSLRAEKTIINCCLNALSAIEDKPFCDMFRNRKCNERISEIFDETYNILSKKYKLKNMEKMKKDMFNDWGRLRHYSSTYQDIKSNRENEVRFFNGYIVELGKRYSLPTQNNQAVINDINKIAK